VHDVQWIDLDGVVNMRDLGGLPTIDGGVIAPGRVIRSDNLQDLPAESVRRLVDDLGLTDVVDLRTFVEVAMEGDGPLRARADVRHHHFTLYPEDSPESGIPAGERELPWVGDPELADPVTGPTASAGAAVSNRPAGRAHDHDTYWSEHYLRYLTMRPDSVLGALRAIAASPGAVVVHCAAGKDRTGTVIGLALKVAGATDEAVVADFETSAQRVPQILARLSGRPAYSVNLTGKTVAQQSPRGETMRLLLEALEVYHGGALGWLTGHGWTAQDTDRLRRKLR